MSQDQFIVSGLQIPLSYMQYVCTFALVLKKIISKLVIFCSLITSV